MTKQLKIFDSVNKCVYNEKTRKDYLYPFKFTRTVFGMTDLTRQFNIAQDKDEEIRTILTTVYSALEEKGYNPINQIVGYILSEDPTYITNHNHARTLIRKLDRDELLQSLVKTYLGI